MTFKYTHGKYASRMPRVVWGDLELDLLTTIIIIIITTVVL